MLKLGGWPRLSWGRIQNAIHGSTHGSMDFSQSHGRRTARITAIRTLHRTIQSVGATGGVYKGQGRSQRELMTRAY
ncbi:hypothetical protein IEQ34_026177 [Dendrobium chrysotoxum]|uniref:Uncharacterized protein n=1 Tax=Dendrobium chrysotoxum TaxID=161865 RepID=A0AAV7FN42_DENCH|nr:hypothetical protein IEQ34_026177 [Dendrobium chrysotoxum]